MQCLQQSPNWPVMRDWIGYRHNGFEPEHAFRVAGHDAPAIWAIMVSVLHVVVARRVGFPDIDLAALDRLAGGVFEGAENKARLAGGISGDGSTVGKIFGFVSVERAEDSTFGAVRWFGVVNRVNEE